MDDFKYRAKRCSNNSIQWIGLLSLGASLSIAGSAIAYEPITTLGQVPGLTNLQQRSGDAVQQVCGAFAGGSAIDQTRDDVAQQAELFDLCGQMVHTGRVLTGEAAGQAGFTSKDLGISAEALGAALQNVTAEEIAAAGSMATESMSGQSSAISRRMATILSQTSQLQVSSANLQPGGLMTGGAASDDGSLGNPLGVYVNALGSLVEKTQTDAEDGFGADTFGISLGVDYVIKEGVVAGINLGYSATETDFYVSSAVSGGDMDSEQTNLAAYGLWFNDVGFLDLVAGFGSGSYDMTRRIVIPSASEDTAINGANDTVVADTDSSSIRFSIGGGMEMQSGVLGFAPYARLSYLSADLDGYEEQGSSALKMRVESQSIDSLTGGFGFRLVGTYSGSKAIVSPQFSVEMIREFMDDRRQIVSAYIHDPNNLPLIFVTDRPDRTYYTMGMGVSAVFQNGVQLFGEVRSLMELDNLSDFSATGGLRFEF